MQHATSISAEEQNLQMASYAAARPGAENKGWVDLMSLPCCHESEPYSGPPRGMIESVKYGVGCVKDGIWSGLSALHPSNIKEKYHMVRAMTWKQRTRSFLKLNMRMAYGIVWLLFMIIWSVQGLSKHVLQRQLGRDFTFGSPKVVPEIHLHHDERRVSGGEEGTEDSCPTERVHGEGQTTRWTHYVCWNTTGSNHWGTYKPGHTPRGDEWYLTWVCLLPMHDSLLKLSYCKCMLICRAKNDQSQTDGDKTIVANGTVLVSPVPLWIGAWMVTPSPMVILFILF